MCSPQTHGEGQRDVGAGEGHQGKPHNADEDGRLVERLNGDLTSCRRASKQDECGHKRNGGIEHLKRLAQGDGLRAEIQTVRDAGQNTKHCGAGCQLEQHFC